MQATARNYSDRVRMHQIVIRHTKVLGNHLKVQGQSLNSDGSTGLTMRFEIPLGADINMNSCYAVFERTIRDKHDEIVSTDYQFIPYQKFVSETFSKTR
ncbi:MAG: hypothetical protein LBH81_02985 [Rickettsiales bacterium]|jgi:hypothetical protein|nr:hypothetical protein [Rickettsiales bacterium]